MDIKEVSMFLMKDKKQVGNYMSLHMNFDTKASAQAIEKLIRTTDSALKSTGVKLRYGKSIEVFFKNRGVKFP